MDYTGRRSESIERVCHGKQLKETTRAKKVRYTYVSQEALEQRM